MNDAERRFRPLSVVMADDNLNDHDLTRRAIEACGTNHMFTSVYNGNQLMDLLLKKGIYTDDESKLPDIILIDLNMRLGDGFETISAIKSNRSLKDIPLYVLTSSNYYRDEERVKKMGVCGFFTKPILYEQTKQLMLKICVEVTKTDTVKH
jgi:two-component system response regulator